MQQTTVAKDMHAPIMIMIGDYFTARVDFLPDQSGTCADYQPPAIQG
jgi:hypothetical protein